MSDDSLQLVDERSTSKLQMSDDSLQLVDNSSTSKETKEWVLEIGGRLDNPVISHPTKPLRTSYSTSDEMPSIFGNWQCWDDIGVSFLPETEMWQFVAYMTRWCGLNVHSYLEYMLDKEHLAWGYYEGVPGLLCLQNGKLFIEHLLVNSCFLIFAMIILQMDWVSIEILGGIYDNSSDQNDQRSIEFDNLVQYIMKDPMSTKHYLMTIDYQIPWFVVEAIYTDHYNLKIMLVYPIDSLALAFFDNLYPRVHESKVKDGIYVRSPAGGFKHLLHIFHWTRTPEGKYMVKRSWKPIKKIEYNFYIPSATDLQLSATVFEKQTGGIDVSYRDMRLSGVMQLAPWHIFEYKIKIYKELLTFEQLYVDCGLSFTAYFACMVCLLRREADVRVLRENGILPGTWSNEKDVLHSVEALKRLLRNDVPMSDDLYDLSKKVRAHHERSSSRSYAEFKRRYCANTWITISVIAGILLFVLTFIQTIYGTLSYYEQ